MDRETVLANLKQDAKTFRYCSLSPRWGRGFKIRMDCFRRIRQWARVLKTLSQYKALSTIYLPQTVYEELWSKENCS